jgi:glycosyltransferase involved in cell wall biosynthesis
MLATDKPLPRSLPKKIPITLAFIGVLKYSQGIEELLETVALKKDLKLKLIGTGSNEIVCKLQNLVDDLGISKQVFFPKRFYYKDDLLKVIEDCHIGVALYEENPNSVTYYADPAKIKQYAEFGFPIITTNTAEITSYIKKFKAGEIVHQNKTELLRAVEKIQKQYDEYTSGVERFCSYFSYSKYFDKKFEFLASKHIDELTR